MIQQSGDGVKQTLLGESCLRCRRVSQSTFTIGINNDIDIYTDTVIVHFRFYSACVLAYVVVECNATASDSDDK